MTASDLAQVLGGRKEGQEYRAACPVHGGRSLCFREKDGRLLVVCRAGCDQDSVISELRRLQLWENGNRSEVRPTPAPERPDDGARKAEKASRIWAEGRPLASGDPVWLYLRDRGIELQEYPQDLRTHAGLGYWEVDAAGKPIRTKIFPCMLALIRNPEGRPVGLHRTYLTEDGHKAPVPSPRKIMKVRDLTGGAVRLFCPADGRLAVCEGLEDALSAWILWGIPCWACLGTSGLKGFEPPAGIRELIILSDRDQNGAGQKAALELAKRMEAKKMAVRIRVPSGHKDINGLLQKEKHGGF